MEKIKQYPVFFSILVILSIILFNRIPLSIFLLHYGYPEFYAEKIENVIMYSIVVMAVLWFIWKNKIPFSLLKLNSINAVIFYLPLVFYIYIFSGGFSDFLNFDFSAVPFSKIVTYGIEDFSAAFLEEVLFRGLILGVLLWSYQGSQNFILRSALVSSLLFGLLHFINIWTLPDIITVQSVFNQMYAAACLGFMYAATYLKTRSILILGVLHFLSNFFSGIDELADPETVLTAVVRENTIFESIASQILTLIIFGIPLLIGLFVLKFTDEKDIEALGGKQSVTS